MIDDLNIRPYTPGDEKAVIRVWHDSNLLAPQNNPLYDIARKLSINPEWFLVGVLEGEIVSTCMAGYEGHRGWINYLAVSPRYQRRGIGTLMMQAAEGELIAAGCPKINLQVRESNTQVIQFYESLGYSIDRVVSLGKRLVPDPPYEADQLPV